VACIDFRSNPYDILSLKPYEAIVIRNVGGRITPALTDLAALDCLFHLDQVVILQHTNCGTTHITKDQLRQDVKTKCPGLVEEEVEGVMEKCPLKNDSEEALKSDLRILKECGFLRKEVLEKSMGLWLDVKSGLVRQVEV
jgi:carbonic anhydrase